MGMMKMKQLTFCLLLVFICASTIAQKDSVRKNHFSINFASGIISGELGLYFDHRLSDKFGFQLSYGHRFYNFHLINNGGYGSSILYFPQTADIVRIGLKKYLMLKKNRAVGSNAYFIYRLSAWNLHTPKYTDREGSNGLNSIKRSVVSIDDNVLNLAFGIGKETDLIFASGICKNKKLFLDLFVSGGISCGPSTVHVYSSGFRGSATDEYYNNRYIHGLALFPVLELGVKLGI
jgi:hypothetical protein